MLKYTQKLEKRYVNMWVLIINFGVIFKWSLLCSFNGQCKKCTYTRSGIPGLQPRAVLLDVVSSTLRPMTSSNVLDVSWNKRCTCILLLFTISGNQALSSTSQTVNFDPLPVFPFWLPNLSSRPLLFYFDLIPRMGHTWKSRPAFLKPEGKSQEG